MDKKIVRFSISLPEELYSELERKVVENRYASRSELVRDLIRRDIVDESWDKEDSEVVAVLTIVYDHHQRELTQKMIDIQHSQFINILCNTHVHIDHKNCLETIIIRGKPSLIEKISNEIGGLKGVKFSKLTKASKF